MSLSTQKRPKRRNKKQLAQALKQERARANELARIARLNERTAYDLACQLHGKDAVDAAIEQAHSRGRN